MNIKILAIIATILVVIALVVAFVQFGSSEQDLDPTNPSLKASLRQLVQFEYTDGTTEIIDPGVSGTFYFWRNEKRILNINIILEAKLDKGADTITISGPRYGNYHRVLDKDKNVLGSWTPGTSDGFRNVEVQKGAGWVQLKSLYIEGDWASIYIPYAPPPGTYTIELQIEFDSLSYEIDGDWIDLNPQLQKITFEVHEP